MRRKTAVVHFASRPTPGPVAEAIDTLEAVLGKVVSFVDVALLTDTVGVIVVNAAGGAGTALTTTRTKIDFGDAGIDSVRVVVRGLNSTAGAVTVQVYDVTNARVLATAVVTGVAEQTATGAWTRLAPIGDDAEVELRVVGDGAMDPTLYAVHFQASTTQART